jgi:hypothetical protein
MGIFSPCRETLQQAAEKLKTERGFGVRRLVAALVPRQFPNVLEITFKQVSKAATCRRTPKSFFSSVLVTEARHGESSH